MGNLQNGMFALGAAGISAMGGGGRREGRDHEQLLLGLKRLLPPSQFCLAAGSRPEAFGNSKNGGPMVPESEWP